MTEPEADDSIDIHLRAVSDVATRAVVLATVARRGIIDIVAADVDEAETARFDLASWATSHFAGEAEADELALLNAPHGSLSEDDLATCLDAGESLAALCWCLLTPAPLPEPDTTADFPTLLARVPQPWQAPETFISASLLRSEEEIATERERAEVWWWRASLEPDELEEQTTLEALETVAAEASTASLLDTVDADLAIRGQAFSRLGEDQRATVLAIAAARLRALNWVCGFGTTWATTPLDID
jgi:hypothetical protein